ncbi:MAG: UDP-N-acetylmuramoylalanine--D-glutamate ligase, partial [Kiritimatiellia bacterium]|nr:UDP-N-acetylmuramoylalanine--D-glutamate ligase [Kiritimatiellia bacterium]
GLLAERARGVYLIGKAADSMRNAWQEAVPCVLCATLEEAVERAAGDAAPGETVLLAPACASFDQFRSQTERGDRFQKASRDWIAIQTRP